MEEDSNLSDFLKYKEEQERLGRPIDPRAVEAGKRELELGAKGSFPVYGDELSRAEKFKNDPEGSLYKTDLSAEQLVEKIETLTKTRDFLIRFLENLPSNFNGLHPSKETTLDELRNKILEKDTELLEMMWHLSGYHFDFDVKIFDLPVEIAEVIKKETRILEHKHKHHH